MTPPTTYAMSRGRLEEIAKREQAATKGPWTLFESSDYAGKPTWLVGSLKHHRTAFVVSRHYPTPKTLATLDFVCHARQDIPDLLREVHRLRTYVKRLQSFLTAFPPKQKPVEDKP